MLELSVAQARALRLIHLGLAPAAPGAPTLRTPAEVATHHLAMQGQDFKAVQWAIGSRLAHLWTTQADVLDAFDRGELIRTWPMRGTVHAMAAADGRWLLDLCGPIALRGVNRRWEYLEIDEAFLETVRTVVNAELAGGRTASRNELVAALTTAGLDFSEGQRRYHSIWWSCQIGLTVLGPTRDGDNLLVLTDEHLPDAARWEGPAGLPELARRYLRARGPARIEDLQHWTKLTKTQCRAAFAGLGEELVEVSVPGQEPGLRLLAEQIPDLPDLLDQVPPVLALAGFDEHLLGYRDRSLVLDPDKATCVDPGRNGVFRHTIVLDGRVVGTWGRRLLKKSAQVSVSLFEPTTASQRKAISASLEPWGRFVGLEPVVTIADV